MKLTLKLIIGIVLLFLFDMKISCSNSLNTFKNELEVGLKNSSEKETKPLEQRMQGKQDRKKNKELNSAFQDERRRNDSKFRNNDLEAKKNFVNDVNSLQLERTKENSTPEAKQEEKRKLLHILNKIMNTQKFVSKTKPQTLIKKSLKKYITKDDESLLPHDGLKHQNKNHSFFSHLNENASKILELNDVKSNDSSVNEKQIKSTEDKAYFNKSKEFDEIPIIVDLDNASLLSIIEADDTFKIKKNKTIQENGTDSSTFQDRIGEASSFIEETSSDNLHITESENILKQIASNLHSPTQQFDPLADLSLWMRPMNSQKNFLFNSTFSVDEKPVHLYESPLKAVDTAEKDKALQLLLERYLSSLALKSMSPSDKNQHHDLSEVIKTIDKLDNSNNDLRLPFDPFNSNFIGSSNINKNSFQIQKNPFSSSSFTNFSHSNGNGIPPEVLANLLVRLRVPTVEEIASVLPDTTRLTPHLSTAFADFISNVSNALAQFITDVQAALAENPILGVLFALAILAIIWHFFPYKFEKKKKGYGYGHDDHHHGGYHRREDVYSPEFRSFDSHGVDILVTVLDVLEQFENKFKALPFEKKSFNSIEQTGLNKTLYPDTV